MFDGKGDSLLQLVHKTCLVYISKFEIKVGLKRMLTSLGRLTSSGNIGK